MEAALIGLAGLLLGIVLNEQLRRRNRIENYSTSIFDKRLDLYHQLYNLVGECSPIATEVIENEKLSEEERHDLVSAGVMAIASFCDENELYLNEEIALHAVSLLMGVEDIHGIEDKEEREEEIKRFRENLLLAKKMIRKESGIKDIDNLFSSITKPKHSSAIIEHYRETKKELGIKGKWE